ncbi:sigma-70 family RNA polymerase sigma factor [Psychrosphaera sp. 1_MG-2023]|uniref:sigma-70 family RNA polymerase sigma factor n=1 Tax=Psychrosphaera sp. 1_MG-2023 TaxID=3062643 RepID=UPI0026E208A3|nr:sigma-70 family RNA polymerase sigma factor [Psychrosphaera sp. 1_MG-2023]MDO6717762.1 sigma-70 family RNA polymerase sigma factor [Psychrosphaera sp. 1_MG-2023]
MTKEHQLFTSFIRQYQATLRSYIRGLGVFSHAVDDIAQETFIVAYKELEKFDQSLDFGHWLKGIARNLVRNETRKHARHNRIMNDKLTLLLIDSFEQSYEVTFGEHQEVNALKECINALPLKSKELIGRKYHMEDDTQVIAEQMAMTPTAIRLSLMRIRTKLKQCLDFRLSYEQ